MKWRTHTNREKSIHRVVQHFQLASRRSLSMFAWSTLFDAENVFRLLPVGVPRSMEENVPEKNHFRLLSDNRQRGGYGFTTAHSKSRHIASLLPLSPDFSTLRVSVPRPWPRVPCAILLISIRISALCTCSLTSPPLSLFFPNCTSTVSYYFSATFLTPRVMGTM